MSELKDIDPIFYEIKEKVREIYENGLPTGLSDPTEDLFEQAKRDRETLWNIWDVLTLWSDRQWSSDEIEMVAEEMQKWTGTRDILPPENHRTHWDEEEYELLEEEEDEEEMSNGRS